MNVFWLCIGIIMILVGLGCLIYHFSYSRGFAADIAPFLITFGMIIVGISGNGIEHDATEKQLAQVEHYYLDGNEVDPDTIDIDLYQYSIKDNNCYLTNE